MRTRLAVALLALVPCTVATALAAARWAPPVIDYVPAYRFAEIRGFAMGTGTMGGTVATAADQQTSYMLVRRTHESEVEEHARWDDVLVVRAGVGAVVFGTRTGSPRVVSPGERRGGLLASPESRVLRVGDVARIPAGVPHAFVPSGTEPWELLIVKVRRPKRSLGPGGD
jgi:mannose-6-phosphate isomerase-like protein (cupin superfamily)